MENPKADVRIFLLALAALLLVLWTVSVRYDPPPVVAKTADPAVFSAARGFAMLERVLGDETPHVIGSTANDLVRQRIIGELKTLGYVPHVHSAFVCRFASCGHVRNIVARLRGRESGNGVMLAVHYDSVSAGPGASDDGQGVAAALEIARALRHRPQSRHDIVLLIDDGEEAGLLGAQAFINDHPWASSIRRTIVVESRGTTGSSLMIESSPGNRWLIDLMARKIKRPAMNSIYYVIYKALPNDTDFTVFKAAGKEGANFASSSGASRYHTPRDDLAHFDQGSLQHHGENALAMLVAFADEGVRAGEDTDAVFFDLFTLYLFRWNEGLTPILAIGSLLALSGVIALLIHRGRMRFTALLWGLGAAVMILAISAGLGFLLLYVLRAAGAAPVAWIAYPTAMTLAFWSIPFVAVTLSIALIGKRAGASGVWAGVWLIDAAAAVVLAFVMPAVSYPFVVSSILAVFGGTVWAIRRVEHSFSWGVASLFPLIAAASLLFPFCLKLYDGVGTGILPATSALVGVAVMGLAPLLTEVKSRWRWLAGMAGCLVLIGGFVVAGKRDPFSLDDPQALSILLHYDADSRRAQWLLEDVGGGVPSSMHAAARFSSLPSQPISWDPSLRAFSAPAEVSFAPPELEILESIPEGTNRRIRAVLRSGRGAPMAAVLVPRLRVRQVKVDGHAASHRPQFSGELATYRHLTIPEHGAQLEFTIEGAAPMELIILDRSYGLPPEGDAIVKSRPLWAVPIHSGDRTLVSRRIRI